MKVSDLSGAELDYWVGKAVGRVVSIDTIGDKNYCMEGHKCKMGFSPSTDWAQGGPIIETMNMLLIDQRQDGGFDAKIEKNGNWMKGDTKLSAAMRCFVASKFGERQEEKETPLKEENRWDQGKRGSPTCIADIYIRLDYPS